MRGFIAALLTFALLCTGVGLNTRFLVSHLDEVYQKCNDLPDDPISDNTDELYNSLKNTWKRYETFVCMTVSHAECEKIKSQLASLEAYKQANDTAGYLSSRAMLIETIANIRRSESFSVDGII